MAQCVKKQRVTLPAIEAECHLVQVGREMFRVHTMPTPHDAALEQRETRIRWYWS
jgi:hypothetical protein